MFTCQLASLAHGALMAPGAGSCSAGGLAVPGQQEAAQLRGVCLPDLRCLSSLHSVFSETHTKFLVFLFLNTHSFMKPQLNTDGNALQVGQVNHDSYSTKKCNSCKIRSHFPSHLYSACLPIPCQNCRIKSPHVPSPNKAIFPFPQWH